MVKVNTQFGYETVTKAEKSQRVDDVFTQVSSVYDRMNDVMSLGTHHVWKRIAIDHLDLLPCDVVADIACGTGDISAGLLPYIPKGQLYAIDPNAAMLHILKHRLDASIPITCLNIACEALSLKNTFDKIIISFGLRNFADEALALTHAYRALKPGGKIVIMEFNPPTSTSLKHSYNTYLKMILPLMGQVIAKDRKSYQYLADSIAVQPSPEQRVEDLQNSGFEFVKHTPLSLGIVGLFEGYRCQF